MAYDREEYARIEAMPLGELIHYMITHYMDYTKTKDFDDPHGSYLQSGKYGHALECLNKIEEKLNALPNNSS